MPRTKVAIWVPTRLLMCFAANLPNAAAPPATLTSATKMPSITRKMKMPALSATAGTRPSLMMVFRVATGMKPATSRPPTRMPMNRDV